MTEARVEPQVKLKVAEGYRVLVDGEILDGGTAFEVDADNAATLIEGGQAEKVGRGK